MVRFFPVPGEEVQQGLRSHRIEESYTHKLIKLVWPFHVYWNGGAAD
jgi:hypothetical protein